MLFGLACLLIIEASGSTAARVAEFVADCKGQGTPSSVEGPHGVIQRALQILVTEVQEDLRRLPSASDRVIHSWLDPFQSAVGKVAPKDLDLSGDTPFGVTVSKVAGRRFIVGEMGDMVRTIAIDGHGRRLALPAEFDFTSWRPSPQELPDNYVLMEEGLTYADGYLLLERLVWLKFKGGRAIKVGAIEGSTNQDYEIPEVHGGLVTARTMDDPLALKMLGTDFVRDRTWDCSRGGLRLVKSAPQNLALRAVDGAIFNAWHATRPTRLQSQIRRLVPPAYVAELDTWSQ